MTERELLTCFNMFEGRSFLIIGRGESYELLKDDSILPDKELEGMIRIGINQASALLNGFDPKVHLGVSMDAVYYSETAMANFTRKEMVKEDDRRNWTFIPTTKRWFDQFSLTTAMSIAKFFGASHILLAGIDYDSAYSKSFTEHVDMNEGKKLAYRDLISKFLFEFSAASRIPIEYIQNRKKEKCLT